MPHAMQPNEHPIVLFETRCTSATIEANMPHYRFGKKTNYRSLLPATWLILGLSRRHRNLWPKVPDANALIGG